MGPWLVLLTALGVIGLAPGVSRATIIFTQDPVSTDTNIGSYFSTSGTTAIGEALGTGVDVLRVTTNTPLTVPSSGQARVEAAGTLFTTYQINPVAPFTGFNVIELNPQIAPAGTTGTFTLTAIDNEGQVFNSGTFTLGNGENRVAAVGQGGEFITQLRLIASGPLVLDVRQVRVTTTQAAVIPEPATMVMAAISLATFGVGAVPRLLRRRRGEATA